YLPSHAYPPTADPRDSTSSNTHSSSSHYSQSPPYTTGTQPLLHPRPLSQHTSANSPSSAPRNSRYSGIGTALVPPPSSFRDHSPTSSPPVPRMPNAYNNQFAPVSLDGDQGAGRRTGTRMR